MESKLKVDQSIPATCHSRRQIWTSQAVNGPIYTAWEEDTNFFGADAAGEKGIESRCPMVVQQTVEAVHCIRAVMGNQCRLH